MSLLLRFLATGASGALLSIAITWALTTYVVGVEHYFSAYLVGIAANLLFNFTMYTLAVFKTKRDHLRRLGIFLAYGILMAFMQGASVRLLTSVVGAEYYLPVIASVIGIFAVLNFFVFKLSLFKEYPEGEHASPKAVLAFLVVCAILLRLAVLLNVLGQEGIGPLIYGDAYSYRELATNLWGGEGFVSSRTTGEPLAEVFRTPGLPLLLAPFAATDTGMTLYFALLAIVGGALLPLITYGIGKRFLPISGALLAAGLVAFEPHLILFSTLPQTEVPFILAAYGGLYALLISHERRSSLYAALGGTLLGFAVLIKPGFFPVFVVTLAVVLAYALWKNRQLLRLVGVAALFMLVLLGPWFLRMHAVTGAWSLSGAGWRNIYTDYVASVRAIEKGTEFSIEKRALKDNAEEAGVPTDEVDNPAYARKLRDYSLRELWEKKGTVVKLEATLLVSYFFQDGYYYQFRRFLLIPADTDAPHISPTFVLMKEGLAGVPSILEELSRQYFIPIAGRLWTLLVFLAAVAGFFIVKHPIRYAFLVAIALSALAATAIGLGVESRLRLPMLPALFLLGAACLSLRHMIRFPHASRHLHPRP